MRIVVDYDKCASTGMCMSFAPEVFQLQGDGTLLLLDETPPDSLREAVQGAVDGCPTEAITIEQ